MNKNQTHGIAKDIIGKVQETAGKITGNTQQEIKGVQKQIAGKAEEALGDAKEGVTSFLEKRAPNYPDKVSSDMPQPYPWRPTPAFKE